MLQITDLFAQRWQVNTPGCLNCIAHPQMYPYHLAHYINRVMRITPFHYYIDMLVSMLVAEKAYHQLPNFTVR